jgi:hypothetical protein
MEEEKGVIREGGVWGRIIDEEGRGKKINGEERIKKEGRKKEGGREVGGGIEVIGKGEE